MPLKVHVVVGGDSFDADGDFTFDEGLLIALRTWVNARGVGTEGAVIEAVTDQLDAQNTALADAVTAHTPPPST